MQLLSEGNIPYKIHESININNNKFNIDFLILKNKTPIAVIEASKMFSIRKEPTCRGRATRGIAYLDHRFQHIKKIYPKILTIILLKTYSDKVDLIKRIAKKEILNTDHVLINEEIKNLKDILLNTIS